VFTTLIVGLMPTGFAAAVFVAFFGLAAQAAVPLDPGRYVGVTEGGRVEFELRADGSAVLGEAAVRWTRAGDVLVLSPAVGAPYEVTVMQEGDAVVLVGPPFGRMRLERAVVESPPPPVMLPWVGAWVHRASGGALVLRLRGDGVYVMQQRGIAGAAFEATGRWRGEGARLTLTPDGGESLDYTARREGADLLIGGGDLPGEVRFVPDVPQ
jgi:hypothetical protein